MIMGIKSLAPILTPSLLMTQCRLSSPHQDLVMRNIILGKDGKIWLVDWGMSGFYPPWFEHVTMVYATERCTTSVSWNLLTPFITDPFFKHMKWMDQIGFALIAYR